MHEPKNNILKDYLDKNEVKHRINGKDELIAFAKYLEKEGGSRFTNAEDIVNYYWTHRRINHEPTA